MRIADIHDALIIRDGSIFLVTDSTGNVPPGNDRGLGMYHADTRFLSGLSLQFHPETPLVLLSTAELGFGSEHVLANRPFTDMNGQAVPARAVQVRCQRVIDGRLDETIDITNYHSASVRLAVRFDLEADFADIFEVRGFLRARVRRFADPSISGTRIEYEYAGLDDTVRRTSVAFRPKPSSASVGGAQYDVTIKPRATWKCALVVDVEAESAKPRMRPRHRVVGGFEPLIASYENWLAGCTHVLTDNEFFNRALDRSLCDLRMLWSTDDRGNSYPVAGTPWFDTLFGRDSLIMSMQTLAFRPDIARNTLLTLARYQGKSDNPARLEQPGKILHELRQSEISNIGELPFGLYYGSVDSTVLFLMLAAQYFDWTADIDLLAQLQPNVLAALNWLDEYGDTDGDGYIEYNNPTNVGLVNQGWKDSSDCIVHGDGSLARGPIALIEVQSYAYAAKRSLEPVLRAVGLDERALAVTKMARRLRRRFEDDYWLPKERYYALALDGEKRPCAAISSNPGHALWSGIATRRHAHHVVERLLSNDLFSGWGIRTLGRRNRRFNPLGYHVGTVWPHDNAIAAFGCKMYGFEEEANEVATALFDAAVTFPYYRLPELFGGDARTAHHSPVSYPVACRPQGWAAGTLPMLLQAVLGLHADASERLLQIVRPRLPYWLGRVQVRGLRVGVGHVDLTFRRDGEATGVDIDSARDVRVEQVDRWPL